MAADSNGKVTAVRSVVYAGMGAYLSTAAPGIPTILHGLMYSGPYDIANIKADIYGVFTNSTPVEAYRGAGRPEATFLLERLMDKVADAVGIDPVEARRRNLIEPFDNNRDVAIGITYDSGNYVGALDQLLGHIGYNSFRHDQEHEREHGTFRGIGVACYCEICGLGPSQVAGAVGFGGGLWESATVRIYATGKVNVFIGTSPHGQGEETTFAQIVADEIGVPVDDVEVIHGDTDNTPMGWGHLRQPHHRGRRSRRCPHHAQAAGQGKGHRGPSAGSRRSRHRVRRRPVLRARRTRTGRNRFRMSPCRPTWPGTCPPALSPAWKPAPTTTRPTSAIPSAPTLPS